MSLSLKLLVVDKQATPWSHIPKQLPFKRSDGEMACSAKRTVIASRA